jgi:hypothetical protein
MNLRMLMNLAALAAGVCSSTSAPAQALPKQPVVTPNGIGSAPMGANPDVPGAVTPPATSPAPRMQIIPAVPVQPAAPPPRVELNTCSCDSTQVPPYTGSPMTRCPCL